MLHRSFIYETDAGVLVGILLVLMLVFIYLGRKVGLKRIKPNSENEAGARGTTISAMFGLLAFLLAFTFGMSASRYDTRRGNIVDEANAIGTAILRADLYPDTDRTAFRNDFHLYVEARIHYFEAGRDLVEVEKTKAQADRYGTQLWARATKLSLQPDRYVATMQMIPALNEMFDISSTRRMAELARVPDSIVSMLFVLSLASAFYLGYSSAGKGPLDWLVAIGFCVLTSVVVYITLDLDRPRRGFIQLTTSHQAMLELRKLF
ncbi:MAG TPA: hypothetical protein VIU12_21960 [Chryseolinea sp.]